jgi:hypothetical protein
VKSARVAALIKQAEVFALKNVRLFYTKHSRMRFVSHLDMTRFMSRIIRRAKLPVWYTEGFNPHLYLTFALPLSLGMESEYEICDIRLTDDEFPIDEICAIIIVDAPLPIANTAITAAIPTMIPMHVKIDRVLFLAIARIDTLKIIQRFISIPLLSILNY